MIAGFSSMKTSHLKWLWSMQNMNKKTTSGEKNQVMNTFLAREKHFRRTEKARYLRAHKLQQRVCVNCGNAV